jgi:hypothetical protein
MKLNKLLMRKVIDLKPFVNKNNNQISFVLPRRQMNFPINKVPSNIRIVVKDIKWGAS